MQLSKLFAVALKHYREAVGLSQEDLAARAGLDRTFVSQLERGLKSPTLTSVEKLAQCLGIEPDLLLMDAYGRREWERLWDRRSDKLPFSPFVGGGIEVKATCGSVPTPDVCRKRKKTRPGLGDSRIDCLTGYDWKAHHRGTNNLL